MNTNTMALGLLPHVSVSTSKPQTVILPLHLAKPLDIERRLVITSRNQQVPAAVVGWMQNDARYRAWFAEAQPEASEGAMVVEAQSAPPTGNETPPTDPDTGKDETGSPEGDLWHADMTVPVLREYAGKYDVDLKSSDLKGDIITALRDRRGEFEDMSEAAPKGELGDA